MEILPQTSSWGNALHFGPFIEWQDWNIWHHVFEIGFYIGPWIFYLQITLWDIEEEIQMLKDRGMNEKEAWDFVDQVRQSLPDPYKGSMSREIEKQLAKR